MDIFVKEKYLLVIMEGVCESTTIGILGGMGPEATLYLYRLIMDSTKANKDQDHIPTLIYQNTQIPNRPRCIIEKKDDFILEILEKSAKKIQNAGADIILLPCNTVHYYHSALQKRVDIPIIDMVEICAQHLQKNLPNQSKFGLIGHSILKNYVYSKRFTPKNLQLIDLLPQSQKLITKLIWDIKTSGPDRTKRMILEKVLKKFRDEKEFQWIILGCTELPLLFLEDNLTSLKIIDPMEILSKTLVKAIKGEIRGFI